MNVKQFDCKIYGGADVLSFGDSKCFATAMERDQVVNMLSEVLAHSNVEGRWADDYGAMHATFKLNQAGDRILTFSVSFIAADDVVLKNHPEIRNGNRTTILYVPPHVKK